MKDNKILQSGFLKVLATILLSFMALAMVYTTVSVAICSQMDTDIVNTTMNSYYYEIRNSTYDVCGSLAGGAKKSDLTAYTENTNYRIEVTDAKTGKVVFTNLTDEAVLRDGWYNAEKETLTQSKEPDSTYHVRYGLSESMEENDPYRVKYDVYAFMLRNKNKNLFGLILSAILFVLDLFYLCMRAGKKSGSDEAELIWFDRIPLDVSGVAFIVLSCCWAAVTLDGLRSLSMSMTEFTNAIAMIIVITFPIGYMALTWLLSVVRRIKTGTFAQGILTWTILKFIVGWVVRLCGALPTILLVGIYLVIYAILCLSREGFSVFVAFLMGCFGLYVAWEYNEIQKVSQRVAVGDLSVAPDSKHMFGNMKKTAMNLVDVRQAVSSAVDRQVKAERLKSELITNVSHDIRTPLTSIVNYVDLLQKETTEEEKKEYLEALDRNSQRLKKLTDDLIEASKASSGNIAVSLMPISVREIVEQAMGEYEEKFEKAKLEPVVHFKDETVQAVADGRLLWRVLSNLLSNVVKYAMPNTRVYIDVFEEDGKVKIVVKNISATTLNIPAEELMERFVRADASRHDGGSGLGLDIAKSLTALQKGTFTIDIDGDLFKAQVALEKA